MRKVKHRFKKITEDFIDGFLDHDVLTLSAALAFYTALSLAPLLLITLSIVGLVGIDMRPGISQEIGTLMGPEAGKAIVAIIENVQERPKLGTIAGILGVITLLFSASGVFAQLHTSLNLIWHSTQKNTPGVWSWVKQRLLSMGMVFTLAFLGIVSLLASAIITFLFERYELLWQALNNLVSVTIFAFVFAAIFKYLPDSKLTWRNALRGGFITSIMFSIGKYFIGLYLGQSAVASAYGAAGSLIMLLIWVYYSAVIFFMGAEFTRALTVPMPEAQEPRYDHLSRTSQA